MNIHLAHHWLRAPSASSSIRVKRVIESFHKYMHHNFPAQTLREHRRFIRRRDSEIKLAVCVRYQQHMFNVFRPAETNLRNKTFLKPTNELINIKALYVLHSHIIPNKHKQRFRLRGTLWIPMKRCLLFLSLCALWAQNQDECNINIPETYYYYPVLRILIQNSI